MADIVHRIGIKAPAGKVYAAVSTIQGLAGWWTEEVTGTSEKGGVIKLEFRAPTGEVLGSMGMEAKSLTPDKEVRWVCKEGPQEWIGTDITFNWN